MKNIAPLIGRILIAIIFLFSGIHKIMDPAGTKQFMTAYGMPLVGLFFIGAVIFEIGGGLSLLLGFKARWGAIALIIFLIPTTLIFHTKFSEQMQVIQFMKNLAILGGLLMIAAFGPGEMSLDERTKKPTH
jgi:putative oxidoreductase